MKLSAILEQRRLPSPAVAPQALAWDGKRGVLWMGSRDLRRVYAIDPAGWKVAEDIEAPGIPWAAVSTNGSIRFTIGEGMNDDRYIRWFVPETGFSETEQSLARSLPGHISVTTDKIFTLANGISIESELDTNGDILRAIDAGAEISGHTFVDGMIYVLRGAEKPTADWPIAQLDPKEEKPEVKDLALFPSASRSLTFDGEHFWSNHRAANEIVSFAAPNSL